MVTANYVPSVFHKAQRKAKYLWILIKLKQSYTFFHVYDTDQLLIIII